jgi:hypothetical protein
MAQFRIGQRVKRVSQGLSSLPLGSEGTITGDHGGDSVCVRWDRPSSTGKPWPEPGWWRHTLAPLTPPGFSEFMERVLRDTGEPLELDSDILEKVRV